MDLSALIFVALAVAWAVYLVPKALRHHEEDALNRSVDGFSDRLRVLARREAVSASEAALVPAGRAGARADAAPLEDAVAEPEESAAPTPAPRAPRPAITPTQRRRRVLTAILAVLVGVVALGVGGVIAMTWVLAPVALLAAWLVACRLMVKSERAATTRVRKVRRTLASDALAEEDQVEDDTDATQANLVSDDTDEIPAVTAEVDDQPDGWTPVPVPLPTYVAKESAGRTVRTIDLDSTGVWSSGRNEADSQLAREASAQRKVTESDAESEQRRASGS